MPPHVMAAADLDTLISSEIPEGRQNLLDSFANLDKVAEYCENNYFQCDNKRAALEETKGYTTQSLASVAYQINTLAYNFLQMIDLQSDQLSEMESQVNHIVETVAIHKEKIARREIGILTTNKSVNRQYKIIAPATAERPVKYVRKPIDYSILDDIGHGVRVHHHHHLQRRTSSSSNPYGSGMMMLGTSQYAPGSVSGPAPTTKPPTPPQQAARYSSSGTLTRNNGKEYRTPPSVINPPQVPSIYAAGIGGGRNGGGDKYGTIQQQPQVQLVHPVLQQQQQQLGTGGTMPRLSSSSAAAAAATRMQNSSNTLGRRLHPTGSGSSSSSQYGTMTRPMGRPPSPPSTPLLPPPPPNDVQQQLYVSRQNSMSDGGRQPVVVALPPDYARQVSMPSSSSWVPGHFIERVTAIYDYAANKEDELSFNEGSTIYVVKKNDDGWWEGVMNGITGLFPGNYVEASV